MRYRLDLIGPRDKLFPQEVDLLLILLGDIIPHNLIIGRIAKRMPISIFLNILFQLP